MTQDLFISREALGAYVGRWRFDYGEATLFERDGKLWIEDVQGADSMLYQGNDTFGFEGDSERLVFHRSAGGRGDGCAVDRRGRRRGSGSAGRATR